MLLYFVNNASEIDERLSRGKKPASVIKISIDQLVSRAKDGGPEFSVVKLRSGRAHPREYILQADAGQKSSSSNPPINFFYSGPGGHHFLSALNIFRQMGEKVSVSMKQYREKDFEILVSTEIVTSRETSADKTHAYGLVAVRYLPFGECDQIGGLPLADEFVTKFLGANENPPRRVLSHCMPEFLSVKFPDDDDQWARLAFQLVYAARELLRAPKHGTVKVPVGLFPCVDSSLDLPDKYRSKTTGMHLGLEYLPD